MSQPKLFRIIDKALWDYKMISSGDKILVGLSGGKDSLALLHYLVNRKLQERESFQICALHIKTDVTSGISPTLISLAKSWNVTLIIKEISVLERLKSGKKMNCWWCSTQRRTELNNYAMKNSFNKIALGHHMDDILETLLMNMLQKGELSTMSPVVTYRKYPVQVIRPLCFCSEQRIIDYCRENNFISETCTCDYQNNSFRKEARKKLFDLTEGDEQTKLKMLHSLKNINLECLL